MKDFTNSVAFFIFCLAVLANLTVTTYNLKKLVKTSENTEIIKLIKECESTLPEGEKCVLKVVPNYES